MAYCYHCMTKLDSPDMPFCPECGQKHNFHQAKNFELPAGTMLSSDRYLIGECMEENDFTLTYIGYDLKMDRKVIVNEVYYKDIFFRNVTDGSDNLNVRYDNRIIINDIMKQISKECIALSEADSLTNVAKVYDWFSENNTAYIVCEYVSDISLAKRAEEIGSYEWENFYVILKPLLESLTALHEKNLYHKNIKPGSIKIRKKLNGTEELVLTEFGFARPTVESGLNFSQSTPYEPPEQRKRTRNEGEYTDIYSAAATIYYALTAAEPNDLISKNIDEIFPLLKPYRKSKRIPENVYYALKYALQPDPDTRCKSIETFITRLETVQKPTAVKSPQPPQPSQSAQPPQQPKASPKPISSQTIIASPQPENTPKQDYIPNIVNDNAVPNAAPKPTAPQSNNYSTYAGNPNTMQQTAAVAPESKSSKKGIIIALSATVCVLLIGIGILTFLLLSKNDNSDKDKDNTESKVTVSETTADNENDDSTNREKNDKKNPPPKDDGENDEQSQTENVENSADDSELNDFKSNAETLNELLQEALNNEEYSSYTLDEFFDLKENPQTEDSYYRTINETNYFTVWTNNKQLVVWNDSNYQEGNSTIEYFYNSDLKEQFEYDFATKFGDVSDILEINEEYRNYLFEYTAFLGIKVTGDTKILELDQCIDRISSQMQNSAIYANDSTDDTTSSESEITTSADYTDDGNAGLYQY